MICLVHLLYAEASAFSGKMRFLACRDCPFRERCSDDAKEENSGQPKTNG